MQEYTAAMEADIRPAQDQTHHHSAWSGEEPLLRRYELFYGFWGEGVIFFCKNVEPGRLIVLLRVTPYPEAQIGVNGILNFF